MVANLLTHQQVCVIICAVGGIMDSRYSHFTVLISSIKKMVTDLKDIEMSEFGLKGTHITCLFYIRLLLEANEEVTATAICKHSFEDKAAVSRAISELEKLGLLVQEGEGQKKYRANLVLTPKGVEVANKIKKKINLYEDKASKDLSDMEKKALYHSLESIQKNLSEMLKNKK